MALLKIAASNGKLTSINFPSNLEELPYANKIEFDVALEDIALWAKANAEQDEPMNKENDDAYYCYLLARAVSAYTGEDMAKVMQLNVSDVIDSHGGLRPTPEVWPEQVADLENVEKTLWQMCQVATNIASGYQFKYKDESSCIIEHAGRRWAVPHVVQQLYDGRKVMSEFSTAQAVESMMIRNYLQEQVNNRPRTEVSAEDVANQRFSAHLRLIAISLAEVVEEAPKIRTKPLPLDAAAFEREISNRVPVFQNISTQAALDVIFFLTSITANSAKSLPIDTFSTPQQTDQQARKSAKPTEKYGSGQSTVASTPG